MLLHFRARHTLRDASTEAAAARTLFAVRTIRACVIASVNGRRIVNFTPEPRCDSVNSAPPSFLISFTTRPATPRPACW